MYGGGTRLLPCKMDVLIHYSTPIRPYEHGEVFGSHGLSLVFLGKNHKVIHFLL